MWLIDKLADKHIIDAIDSGEMDNLPGAGKPLQLEDDSMVPEELRVGYRLLKNAGFLPPEMKLRKEIASVEQLLAEVSDSDEAEVLDRRMQLLLSRLNMMHGDSRIWEESYYTRKLQEKIRNKT